MLNFIKAERLQLSILHHKKVNPEYLKSISTLNLCKYYLNQHELLQNAIKSTKFAPYRTHLNSKNQVTKDSITKCIIYINQHVADEKLKEEKRKKDMYEEKINELYRTHLASRSNSLFLKDFLTMRY